ncbi:MAG: phage holin family protein [Planctomycetia bacterium]|jgi:hypothetical protein
MFGKLRENLNTLSREVRESVALRYRLAMIELKADLANLRSLVVVFVLALVGVLTGVAVLAVWVAELLDEYIPLCAELWYLIVGLTAIVFSLLLLWFAWRRFRRRWVGLEQTLEELREDIVWLKEWAGKEPAAEEPVAEEPASSTPSEPDPPAEDPPGGTES